MALAITTRRRNALAALGDYTDAQFVDSVRLYRANDPLLFDDLTFQFQLRLELDLRLLGQVVKLRA